MLDGLTYAVDPSESRPVDVPEGVRALQEEIYDKSYKELDSPATVGRFMIQRVVETPIPVVQLVCIKAARAWYGTDSGVIDRWLFLFQIPVVSVLILAVFQALRRPGVTHAAALLILITVVYFWVMAILVLSIVRYMVPALAMLMALLPAVTQAICTEKRSVAG